MDAGIIENCGKFNRVAPAGFHLLTCPCESIVARMSLKIKQLDVKCDTKTKVSMIFSIYFSVKLLT